MAWQLALGAAAFVLGAHELVFAVQLTFRVAGAVVMLVGLGLLASCVGFARRQGWCYLCSVAAGFVAGLLCLMFTLAQSVNYPRGLRVSIWLSLAVISWLVVLAVAKEGRINFDSHIRRRVKIASSVVSLGAIVSIVQFWNGAVRIPPAAAPSVAVDVKLEQLPPKRGMARLEGTLTVRNTSSTKVWVLGSLYNLLGASAERESKTPHEFSQELEQNLEQEFLTYGTSHYTTKRYAALIESGQFVGDLTYFVPGDELTYHQIFFVPNGRYDLVRLTAMVAIAKETLVLEIARPRDPHLVVSNGTRRVAAERTVRETSWLGRFLRGARVEHTDVVLDRSSGYLYPYILAYVDLRDRPVSDGESSYSDRMRRIYGIGYADSAYELALP